MPGAGIFPGTGGIQGIEGGGKDGRKLGWGGGGKGARFGKGNDVILGAGGGGVSRVDPGHVGLRLGLPGWISGGGVRVERAW